MSGPTLTEQLQDIVRQYRQARQEWPATTRQISAWGIRKALWKSHPDSLVSQLAELVPCDARGIHYR